MTRSPYFRALASPGALGFSLAALVGRLQIGMTGLGTVLLVAAITGSYGLAGVVAAAGSAGYALASPLTARLADRFGQSRVLPPLVLVYAVSTASLIVCAERDAPGWAMIASSAVAGAATPQIGSMVRARWSATLARSPLLQAAFSLESVADEVVFVAGPVLVTLLATEVYPAAGLAVAVVTCVIGSLALAAQRGTEPATSPALPRTERSTSLPAKGLVTLVPLMLFFGGMLAAVDLATVDFAQRHGHKPLTGVVLGVYALGSGAGGLWYGARTWTVSLRRRLTLALTVVTLGTATFWAMPGLIALALVMVLSGTALSPVMIASFSIVEQQALPGRQTEGMAWLTSAISVGTAGGSAVAGHVVDAAGPRWAYAFAATCAAASLFTTAVGRTRLTVQNE